MYNEGIQTFTANGALGANLRVKITQGSTTVPPQVELAGAGEQHIGVAEFAVIDGSLVTVRLRNLPGSEEMVAAKTISVGAAIYPAADGKISDEDAGSQIGVSKQAASADGSNIEVIPL